MKNSIAREAVTGATSVRHSCLTEFVGCESHRRAALTSRLPFIYVQVLSPHSMHSSETAKHKIRNDDRGYAIGYWSPMLRVLSFPTTLRALLHLICPGCGRGPYIQHPCNNSNNSFHVAELAFARVAISGFGSSLEDSSFGLRLADERDHFACCLTPSEREVWARYVPRRRRRRPSCCFVRRTVDASIAQSRPCPLSSGFMTVF